MKLFNWFQKRTPPGGDRRDPTLRRRSYDGAKTGRLTSDWFATTTSSDAELNSDLPTLRNRSRSLCRDNVYARRARNIFQSNVVGTGIRMQSIRLDALGNRREEENRSIELAWWHWSMSNGCHTGGMLSLTEILRLAIGEVFEAGEVLLRFVDRPFGNSKIPLAIEVIEAERLVSSAKVQILPNGNQVRMGVEVDEWGRPQAYWVYRGHPGDSVFRGYNSQEHVRIPAEECVHLYVCNRWPQTRGEPWMATVIRRLRDIDMYSKAELIAARAAANIMGFIKKPEDAAPGADDDDDDEARSLPMSPGEVWWLNAGESYEGFNPSRPNTGLDPFLRFMVREVATGIGVSYEVLSRDYSNSNYPSSRLSILDDRQAFKVLQNWLIAKFLYPCFRRWFRAASLAGAFSVQAAASEEEEWLESVRFQAPGWSWIDPTKEIAAYVAAVQAGFTTVSDVIAQTGGDAEDTFKARRTELDYMAELGLEFSTSSGKATPPPEPPGAAEPAEPADADASDEPGDEGEPSDADESDESDGFNQLKDSDEEAETA